MAWRNTGSLILAFGSVMFLPCSLSNLPKWNAIYSYWEANELIKETFVKSLYASNCEFGIEAIS